MDGFGLNLLDRLGVSHGRIDSVLVKIKIGIWIRELFNIQSDSSPLRDRAKNDIVLCSTIFQKCIGPDMFSWIRHYVVEVCAPPSALLVCFGFTSEMSLPEHHHKFKSDTLR